MFEFEHKKHDNKCSNIKQPLSNMKIIDSYEQLELSSESLLALTES